MGEEICAWVRHQPDVHLSANDLIEFCRARVSLNLLKNPQISYENDVDFEGCPLQSASLLALQKWIPDDGDGQSAEIPHAGHDRRGTGPRLRPRERDSTLNKLAFDALHHLSTADCAFVSGLWELVGYSHRKYIFKEFQSDVNHKNSKSF